MNDQEIYKDLPLWGMITGEDEEELLGYLRRIGIDVDCHFTRSLTVLGLYHILRDRVLVRQIQMVKESKGESTAPP